MRISRLYLATLLGSLASRATGVLAIAALVIAAAACGGGEAEQPPVSGSPAGSVPALVGEVPGDLAAVIDRTVIVHTTAGQRREVARMLAGQEDSDHALAHADELLALGVAEFGAG